MVVTPIDIDAIRKRVAEGAAGALQTEGVSDVTVGAALELACAGANWRSVDDKVGLKLLEDLAARVPLLRAAIDAFSGRETQLSDALLRPLDRGLVVDSASDYFMRFQQALRYHGFANRLDYGIVEAFKEMADNVIQHSGPSVDEPARAIVGYRVRHESMTFGVADLGRGVLASLKTNPRWTLLTNAREALVAAVCRRATRRAEVTEGSGFSNLHRALADTFGHLRFRSGGASLSLDGRASPRHAASKDTVEAKGFQLSVTCCLSNLPHLL
jgi:hypothetical protein